MSRHYTLLALRFLWFFPVMLIGMSLAFAAVGISSELAGPVAVFLASMDGGHRFVKRLTRRPMGAEGWILALIYPVVVVAITLPFILLIMVNLPNALPIAPLELVVLAAIGFVVNFLVSRVGFWLGARSAAKKLGPEVADATVFQ